jgi:DNA-binding NtrC family response regulator
MSVPSSAILVVDDDAAIASEVAEFLKRRGFEVVDVHSGAAAIACLETRDFAAVFSDIDMPGHPNGIGLAHWVRERRPATQIILTSGAYPWICADSPIAGVPFLAKPADLDRLVVLLRDAARTRPDTAQATRPVR